MLFSVCGHHGNGCHDDIITIATYRKSVQNSEYVWGCGILQRAFYTGSVQQKILSWAWADPPVWRFSIYVQCTLLISDPSCSIQAEPVWNTQMCFWNWTGKPLFNSSCTLWFKPVNGRSPYPFNFFFLPESNISKLSWFYRYLFLK